MTKFIASVALLILSVSCNSQKPATYRPTGSIERIDPLLDSIIAPGARPEIIAEGLDWSEGPLWVESHKMLLFSDVPRDTVFKWTEARGKEVYLIHSGYTGAQPRGGEMGSNGLLLNHKNQLVLCQCGNRQMALMNAPLDKPAPNYTTLAGKYNGKKFNSPNDAVLNTNGDLYFTDPPYGLEKYMNDPLKEIPFQGVYRVRADGVVQLITDSLTRPNGIAILPGSKTLLVANSDGRSPNWYKIDITNPDRPGKPVMFASAANQPAGVKGAPDGMKVDSRGNLYASGPGGIWIFTKDAKLIGKIKLDEAASNCALSSDEKTLYITNDMYIVRLKMR